MTGTGNAQTKQIVIRGNFGSGKSAVAERIRQRYGRGLAIVGQDTTRREVLKERNTPGAANVGLIDMIARYAFDHGFHVIVEGILYAEHYGDILTGLCGDHRGSSHCFSFDVSFGEILRCRATKPQATEYGESEMRARYRPLDLLATVTDHRIPETTSLDGAVEIVMRESRLAAEPVPGNGADA